MNRLPRTMEDSDQESNSGGKGELPYLVASRGDHGPAEAWLACEGLHCLAAAALHCDVGGLVLRAGGQGGISMEARRGTSVGSWWECVYVCSA